MKFVSLIVCIVFIVAASSVGAEEMADFDRTVPSSSSMVVNCQNGNMTRVVELVYTAAPGEPPCEVHYKKITEQPGHDQILWNSEHTKNYCESKQRDFVEMLAGLGWTCQ